MTRADPTCSAVLAAGIATFASKYITFVYIHVHTPGM